MSTRRTFNVWERLRDAARRDDGMALATVTAISAVLFLLATTLLMLATQQQVSASNQVQRTKALQAADAGLNAYLYQLSKNSLYATTNPTLTGSTADSSWTVQATPPSNGSAVTSITAVGSIKAWGSQSGVSRKVQALVRPGSFSDYMMLTNGSISLAAGGTIKGSLCSNTSIANYGTITQDVITPTYTGYSGSVVGGIKRVPPTYPFTPVAFASVDFGTLQSIATTDGTYYPDSGSYGTSPNQRHYWGYKVTLGGTGGTIAKITSVSTTSGVIATDPSTATSFTVPPNGVVYFNDSIWLSGTYQYKITIVSYPDREEGTVTNNNNQGVSGPAAIGSAASPANGSVFIYNNLQSADPSNSQYVCGVVSQGDISFTSEYPTSVTPDSLLVQAALLSTKGSVHADMDWTDRITKSYIKILGAEASYDTPYIKSGDGLAGFVTRDYWYDYNLDSSVPPNYPSSNQGLKVNSWIEK